MSRLPNLAWRRMDTEEVRWREEERSERRWEACEKVLEYHLHNLLVGVGTKQFGVWCSSLGISMLSM
jgi:hypothetical protein